MRKLLSVIVLSCMLVYIGGYHLVYALYKQTVKRDMREWLSVHRQAQVGDAFSFVLEGRSVTDPAFEWEEQDREFSYHGTIYDVVMISYEPNRVHITALQDGKENDLAKQLFSLDHNRQGKENQKAVLKLFPVFLPVSQSAVTAQVKGEDRLFAEKNSSVPFRILAIQTPPPRAALF